MYFSFSQDLLAYWNFDDGTASDVTGNGYDGIPNSLAIELDTYANDSTQIENFADPNDNHIAILSNSTKPNSSKHSPPFIRGQTTKIPPIKTDGTIYYALIEYTSKDGKFAIWMVTTENFGSTVLEVTGIDLSELLNLDAFEGAHIGFASATGNASENQDLLAWSFFPKSWKVYSQVSTE